MNMLEITNQFRRLGNFLHAWSQPVFANVEIRQMECNKTHQAKPALCWSNLKVTMQSSLVDWVLSVAARVVMSCNNTYGDCASICWLSHSSSINITDHLSSFLHSAVIVIDYRHYGHPPVLETISIQMRCIFPTNWVWICYFRNFFIESDR